MMGLAQRQEGVFSQLEGQHSAELLAHKAGEGSQEGAESSAGNVDNDALHIPTDKDLKPSISSEEDKPEDDDLLSKLVAGMHCRPICRVKA
jgi:hypothetical protein